ncbi:hypothetical protein LSUE1_G010093, partial [Lachnellula suecica]
MDLPSTFKFQGWDIRYSLKRGLTSNPNQPPPKCVVFVHGTPWSSDVFRPVIQALLAKTSYRILVYDLPGYGQSQEYDPANNSHISVKGFQGDTSVKFQAAALTELLQHVQLDGKDGNTAPAIIAHDIAGTIVLRAHLLHGCEFDTMMLLDTNTVLPWGDGFYKLVRSEPEVFLQLPPGIFEAVVWAVIRSACHNPQEDSLARPWIGSAEQQRSFVRQIAQADDGDVAEMLEGDMYA